MPQRSTRALAAYPGDVGPLPEGIHRLALPTPFSARIARNTQLFLIEESGTTRVVDPWGGSYYVERLTADLAARARTHIREVEALGGMAKAIETGVPKMRIEEASARKQARIDSGKDKIIGVNVFRLDKEDPIEILEVDNSAVRESQIVRLKKLKRAFNVAVDWELLEKNPFGKVSFLKVAHKALHYLSPEDFEKLISVITEEQFKDIVLFAVCTGCRRAEITNLTWEKVNLTMKFITIQSDKNFQVKAGRLRALPISPFLMSDLCDQFSRPLRDLRISVTDRCNLACSFCHQDFGAKGGTTTLNMEVYERVLKAAKKEGIKVVRLTGGEPLVLKSIDGFLRRAKDRPVVDGQDRTLERIFPARQGMEAFRDATPI